MPTIARRPAAQPERERLQTRRLRAAELFAMGVRHAEIARQLGVSAQAVSVWHARWQQGGADALRSRGPTGPSPKVSDARGCALEEHGEPMAQCFGLVGLRFDREAIATATRNLNRLGGIPTPEDPAETEQAFFSLLQVAYFTSYAWHTTPTSPRRSAAWSFPPAAASSGATPTGPQTRGWP